MTRQQFCHDKSCAHARSMHGNGLCKLCACNHYQEEDVTKVETAPLDTFEAVIEGAATIIKRQWDAIRAAQNLLTRALELPKVSDTRERHMKSALAILKGLGDS